MTALIRKVAGVLLVVLGCLLGSPPAGASGSAPTPAATSAPVTRPAPGTAEEIEQLAARQLQASDLEPFEGGARIGTTSIIIILLLFIVLILLIR